MNSEHELKMINCDDLLFQVTTGNVVAIMTRNGEVKGTVEDVGSHLGSHYAEVLQGNGVPKIVWCEDVLELHQQA